jgi:O-antigen/teichoic acid export membrane protein
VASVRKSLAISFIGQYIQIGLQLASFFMLARLLTPGDIGLFAVASAAIGIAHLFRDFGMNSYLVQEKELTDDKIATVFTLTLIFSSTLFLILFLSASLIADFYKDERLIDIFRLLAFNFLLIPLNSTPLTLMRREMLFGQITWINIISSVLWFITAMTLASQGFGYYSLIWASIANTITGVVSVSFFRRGGMFQRLTLCEWRTVLSFSYQVTVTNVTGYLSANANDLIIGKFLGFNATGIISRAQGVMNLFARDITNTIRSVAFSAFANTNRDGGDVEADYVKAVTMLTAFAWPFYGFFSLYPVEALRLLFGPQWDAAGILVPWFCATGAAGAICSLIPTVLTALGGAKYLLRFHLILDPLRIFTFIVVTYYFRSMEAFAITFLIFSLLFGPLMFYYKDKVLPTRYKLLLAGLAKSLFASVITLTLPALLIIWVYFDSIGISIPFFHENLAWIYKAPNAYYIKDWLLIPIGLLMIPSWILGLMASHHPLTEESAFKKIAFYKISFKHEKNNERI